MEDLALFFSSILPRKILYVHVYNCMLLVCIQANYIILLISGIMSRGDYNYSIIVSPSIAMYMHLVILHLEG